MNRSEIIKIICSACCCDVDRAEEYLDAELRKLHELRDAGDLRYDDLETACSGLGLDYDYAEYFITALA